MTNGSILDIRNADEYPGRVQDGEGALVLDRGGVVEWSLRGLRTVRESRDPETSTSSIVKNSREYAVYTMVLANYIIE